MYSGSFLLSFQIQTTFKDLFTFLVFFLKQRDRYRIFKKKKKNRKNVFFSLTKLIIFRALVE